MQALILDCAQVILGLERLVFSAGEETDGQAAKSANLSRLCFSLDLKNCEKASELV